jgi:hypothetical protein
MHWIKGKRISGKGMSGGGMRGRGIDEQTPAGNSLILSFVGALGCRHIGALDAVALSDRTHRDTFARRVPPADYGVRKTGD